MCKSYPKEAQGLAFAPMNCYNRHMENFGENVRRFRERAGLSQQDLASRLGMKPAQLCRIESTGNPQIETAARIAKALRVPLADLLPEGEGVSPASVRKDAAELYVPVSQFVSRDAAAILKLVLARERRFDRLEERRRIEHATLLPLRCPYAGRANCGALLANELRSYLGVASSPFKDLAALLEFQHVRLHVAALPRKHASAAFWQRENDSLTVVVPSGTTPERRLYRIAYELGMAAVFLSKGTAPLAPDEAVHRFATEFAVEFLLPAAGVVKMVSTARVAADAWTPKTVCRLKSFFGVSAELFTIRLEELGLVSQPLGSRLHEAIKAHYKKHPDSLEPKPCLPPNTYDMRLGLLAGEEAG